MKLLPDNPTQFDYLHAIRAVASRCCHWEIFDLADAGMQVPSNAPEQRAMAKEREDSNTVNLATPSKEATLDVVWELLVENAFVSHDSPIDRNLTFQELGMDSLDITKLVVEVEGRFGIKLDTENVWPTNVAELVNMIPQP